MYLDKFLRPSAYQGILVGIDKTLYRASQCFDYLSSKLYPQAVVVFLSALRVVDAYLINQGWDNNYYFFSLALVLIENLRIMSAWILLGRCEKSSMLNALDLIAWSSNTGNGVDSLFFQAKCLSFESLNIGENLKNAK